MMSWCLWILSMMTGCVLCSRTLFHDYQLESYQIPGYIRTVRRNPVRAWTPGIFYAVVQVVPLVICTCWPDKGWVMIPLAVALVLYGLYTYRKQAERKAKKKFVVTARVKRLLGCAWLVDLLLGFLLLFVFRPYGAQTTMQRFVCSLPLAVFPVLLPVTTGLAGVCSMPMEKGIQTLYFRDAQRILRQRPDLICIGITGSYGKTSVKFILRTLLSERFQTLATPSSFNTPMGVTKVIRTSLRPSDQVFLAEMGARHVGDIRELCRLVHPSLGVLTSVGPQHLDTFRTIERVRDTKYELIESLPDNGCAFFSDDAGICRELYDKTEKPKMLAAVGNAGADVWAEDIQVSAQGSNFMLCTKNERVACHTVLLGEHNIRNIVLAASVCLYLGMSLREIGRGIGKVTGIEHRLQLRSMPGGVTMIDDAFNSNPSGSRAALDVLRAFPGRRLIVTPGMVELGDDEDAFNRTFGEHMADCADLAILVGPKHTSPIREGLLSKGFDPQKIVSVKSLDEATQYLKMHVQKGDTVLFENDLPDNYSEN